MPIRLNLLAEQQALEEARRRDPVKRGLWAAGAIVAVFLLIICQLQFSLLSRRSELAAQEAQWKHLEPGFLSVSNQFRESGLVRKKIDSLQRYATNRFLWTPALNTLQHLADEQARVVSFSGALAFTEHKQLIASTNLYFDLPPRPWWSWRRPPLQTNVQGIAQNTFSAITNKPDFARFLPELTTSLNVVTSSIQVVAKIDAVRPETVVEKISMRLSARDYSQPAGSRVDAFFAVLTNSPYFKPLLGRTNATVQTDSIQAVTDPSDTLQPSEPFIQFTIRCFLPEQIRSNE